MATLNDLKRVNGYLIDTGSNDFLAGTSDSDLINVYAGNDTVYGGAGNDYIFDSPGVTGQGTSGADHIYGGSGDDVIVSNLDGAGNVYDGNDGIDMLNFAPMQYGVYVDLAQGFAQNRATLDTSPVQGIENVHGTLLKDRLYGNYQGNLLAGYGSDDFIRGYGGNDRLEGDDGFDVLFGGTDNDSIYGGNQNDVLYGEAGSDFLSGDAGTDFISGGTGKDYLGGGLGADTFEFRALAHSGTTNATMDVILDFEHLVDDINVSRIDANAALAGNQSFVFKGSQAFSGAGQVRYVYDRTNDDTVVLFNTDADNATEMAIRIDGIMRLSASDFIL